MRWWHTGLVAVLSVVFITDAFTGPVNARAQQPPMATQLKVAAIFSSTIQEPWIQVIHRAYEQLKDELHLDYEYVENVPAADMEQVIRTYVARGFAVISGEAFGNEQAFRRVAREHPGLPFLIGSGLGAVAPNVAVFDNWLHEAAYLAGMVAGKVTRSNVLGVVAGYAVSEVNRLVNAFRAGASEVNPQVKVHITFIDSWFDAAKAREAAIAQIQAGADVLYAERLGVIEACKARGVKAIGNILDQHAEAPEVVLTSITWNMQPTIRAAIEAIRGGHFKGMDYAEYSMLRLGGAALAPWHGREGTLPSEVVHMVEKRRQEIVHGMFRVAIDESIPRSD